MNTALPIVQTPSRVEAGAGCHRRHFIDDVLSLRKSDDDVSYPALGTVLHGGAAVWWRTQKGEAVRSVIDRLWPEYGPMIETNEKLSRSLVEGMMATYVGQAQIAGDHWAKSEPGWELLTSEERVAVPLWPEAELTFMVDRLVVHEEHGLRVLVDTKTKGKWGPMFERQWLQKWEFSLQQMLYQWAVRETYGWLPDEHFIEAVVRDTNSQVTYVRLPHWSDSQLKEVRQIVIRIAQKDAQLVARSMRVDGSIDAQELVRLAVAETEFNPGACNAGSKIQCPHYELCTAPVEDRVALLQSDYKEVKADYLE